MKHQQVTVNMTDMITTAVSYLALAGAVWMFLRLIQACFWLPKHLKRQNDVQQMLQEKVKLNIYINPILIDYSQSMYICK